MKEPVSESYNHYCRRCELEIVWMRNNKSGSWVPFNASGVGHSSIYKNFATN